MGRGEGLSGPPRVRLPGRIHRLAPVEACSAGIGRADMAQAGGTYAAKLPEALGSVKSWVEQRL